jgi:osmoprotectant transport system substrate-binding protein
MALAACSSTPSTTTASPTTSDVMASPCVPVPGNQLVVLADDQHLQTVDNIIPAVNAKTAVDGAIMGALDRVSAALTTDKLMALNEATDVEQKSSTDVAAQFVADEGLKPTGSRSGKLVIGSANFSENITLAEIYAAVLRDTGYTVEVRTIGSRETYLPALEKGDVDIVPEYAGTVTEFLNKAVNGADAAPLASGDLDATVANLRDLGKEVGLAFGHPSPAQDQNAFAVTKAFADEHGVTSLSELANECGPISLGGPPECPDRPFCQPGLENTYGLEFDDFLSLDPGGPLTKAAIRNGDVVLGLVFSSDGTLGG